MAVARSVGAFLLRWRYPLLALWSLPWLITTQMHAFPRGDWIFVEMGSRILAHHHAGAAAGAPLHLYADNSLVQMGPPALLAAAPFQWLPPHIESHLATGFFALSVLPALWCAELAARSVVARAWIPLRVLLAGLIVVPVWTVEVDQWGHIDDVIALLAVLAAAALVSRGSHEPLAGLILGTGAAAKPWAVIVMPLLLVYARPKSARAILAFVVGALIWWAPFVIAAPDTVHALGTFHLPMVNHPMWQLFGLGGRQPSWIRPLQLGGGVLLSSALIRRIGWAALPVVAFAWRVTTDPYDWPYYVMGPLLGAALWDVARPRLGRLSALPWSTIAVFVVGFWIPREWPAVGPVSRLALFAGLTAVALMVTRFASSGLEDESIAIGRLPLLANRPTAGPVAPIATAGLP